MRTKNLGPSVQPNPSRASAVHREAILIGQRIAREQGSTIETIFADSLSADLAKLRVYRELRRGRQLADRADRRGLWSVIEEVLK